MNDDYSIYEEDEEYEELPEKIIRYPGKEVTCLILGIIEMADALVDIIYAMSPPISAGCFVFTFFLQFVLGSVLVLLRIKIDCYANYTTKIYKVGSVLCLIGYGLSVLFLVIYTVMFTGTIL